MAEQRLPRLRALDIRPIFQDGRSLLMLRDPLQLSERAVIIPRELAPVLAFLDGSRDLAGLRAALMVRLGLRFDMALLERLVAVLDESFLLENERFLAAKTDALAAYRNAPFRPPLSAGQGYPEEADALRQMLDSYLHGRPHSQPRSSFPVRGLLTPHIDYARGGPVYAAVWGEAAESIENAELAVILGTDHWGSDGTFTLTRQNYATPYGVLPTAQGVVDVLAEAIGSEEAFAGELHHRTEHSIELAAVWLHHMRQGRPCEIVPILCGSFGHFIRNAIQPREDQTIQALVATLQQVISAQPTLIVAAGDLAHVGPAFGDQPLDLSARAQLQAADEQLIREIVAGDAEGFFQSISRVQDRYNICGLPPIYLALRLLSPTSGALVAYDRCPADAQGTSVVSVCGVLFS
jgi:AmmeMemoRadiSam system protein B